jgi:hypothetical protein
VRYLLRSSALAILIAAALGVGHAVGVSAQTVTQTTQSCATTSYAFGYYGAPQTCTVTVPSQQLTPDETVFVQPTAYSSLDPQTCQGENAGSYTTLALSSPVPYSYVGQFSGSNLCVFEVTAGTVPPGYPVGSFGAAAAAGTVDLQALVCGDPSCGTALNVPYSYYPQTPVYSPPSPPVVYTAPAPVYTPPSPTVIYTPPAVTYTPPADQDGSGHWQDPRWQGDGGQWHDPHGSDSDNGQANGGQSDDPNHHHDDHSSGQQSGGSWNGSSAGDHNAGSSGNDNSGHGDDHHHDQTGH